MFALVARIIPMFLKSRDRKGTIATTAPCFADLILGAASPSENGGYVSVRGGKSIAAEPSELARTPGLAAQLWSGTEALLDRVSV